MPRAVWLRLPRWPPGWAARVLPVWWQWGEGRRWLLVDLGTRRLLTTCTTMLVPRYSIRL